MKRALIARGRKAGRKSMASAPDKAGSRRRWMAPPALAMLSIALYLGVARAHDLLLTTDRFRLVALEVHGLRLLTGVEVLEASGLAVGDNIFAVDLDSVATRLEDMVWVRTARIERKPPDRLVVSIEERQRVAWMQWGNETYALDAGGVLLPSSRLATERIADLDLPVLLPGGLDDPRPLLGMAVADSCARNLLAWWLQVREVAPDVAAEISQIEPLSDRALRLRLVADDLEVRVPAIAEVGPPMAALREIVDRVYSEGRLPAYVDLRYRGQAVVGSRVTAEEMGVADELLRNRELENPEPGHG